VSTAVEDLDFERALELRGPEFQEMLVAFHAVSCFPEASARLPAKKRMRIGIVQ
jgi:6-phosphofructokinase 1